MSSIGAFSWGFSPKIEPSEAERQAHKQQQQQQQQQQELLSSIQAQSHASISSKSKRRHQDDDLESSPSVGSRRGGKKVDKFRISKKELPQKKNKSILNITGQQLSTQRVLEVLEKKDLQQLLNNLVMLHPEISQDIYRCAPKPSVSSCIKILSDKINVITNSIPYNVDPSSEYCFLRLKPLIMDFLNALSDYTLNFMAPVETQPAISLEFLDQATNLLHQLPEFSSFTNNYYKNLAYEQLSHTWCSCLKDATKSANALLLIHENWEFKIKKHNDLSQGKLANVLDFFKTEVGWLTQEFNDSPSQLSSQNFSINNSPCALKSKFTLDGFR